MSSGYNSNNNIIEEDYSESQTTMNPEQFEDEPGTMNHRPYHNGGNIVYPAATNDDPYDNRYRINDDEEEVMDENATRSASDSRYNNGPPNDDISYIPSNNNDDQYNDHSLPEHAPSSNGNSGDVTTPPPRKHKYSTANLREQGKWKKWCKILLMLLIMISIMIGISMLMNHFFFGDVSDNGPPEPMSLRNENGTFARDKQDIDSACGRDTLEQDQGTLCKEACIPEFFHCCDPFDEFVLYNYTVPIKNSTKTTINGTIIDDADDGKLTSDRYKVPDEKNLTFLEGYEKDETCTFDMNVRGCMAYAKCHALAGQTDPAPSNLPEICSLQRIQEDSETCTELCRKLDCCYSTGSDNCLAEKFDLCMDYGPCQNLRTITVQDPSGVLEIAPRTLDYDCYNQKPSCIKTCDKARCCSEVGDYSCLQYNFLSCVTYAPCNNVTEVNITIPTQFIHVPQPSIDLVYACDTDSVIIEPTDRSCEEICSDAACCWSTNADENCFHLDPLGCLTYEAQCQALISN